MKKLMELTKNEEVLSAAETIIIIFWIMNVIMIVVSLILNWRDPFLATPAVLVVSSCPILFMFLEGEKGEKIIKKYGKTCYQAVLLGLLILTLCASHAAVQPTTDLAIGISPTLRFAHEVAVSNKNLSWICCCTQAACAEFACCGIQLFRRGIKQNKGSEQTARTTV